MHFNEVTAEFMHFIHSKVTVNFIHFAPNKIGAEIASVDVLVDEFFNSKMPSSKRPIFGISKHHSSYRTGAYKWD